MLEICGFESHQSYQTMRKQILENITQAQFGCSCMFVPIERGKAAKVYRTKGERNYAAKKQRLAFKLGFGPKVYKSFDLSRGIRAGTSAYAPKGSVYRYGYVTQIATCVHRYDGSPTLERKMHKHKFSTYDLHGGNIGRIGRRLVCIDFDRCSVGAFY